MDNHNFLVRQHEELIHVHKVAVDSIEFAKRRQWAITYYVLLTFTGIAGFWTLMEPWWGEIEWYSRLFLVLGPAYVVNLVGMWHIIDTHTRMCRYRMKMILLEEHFTQEVQDISGIALKKNKKKHPDFWRYFPFLTCFFGVLLTASLFLLAWYISENQNLKELFVIVILMNPPPMAWFVVYHYGKYKKAFDRFERLAQQ